MNTQVAALNAASRLIGMMSSFETLYHQVNQFVADYNQNVYDTFWQEMATIPLNPDGSPAGAADATPNTNNPINLPADAPILVSRDDLINGVAMLMDFQAFMSQSGGTVVMPQQSHAKTAALITG